MLYYNYMKINFNEKVWLDTTFCFSSFTNKFHGEKNLEILFTYLHTKGNGWVSAG